MLALARALGRGGVARRSGVRDRSVVPHGQYHGGVDALCGWRHRSGDRTLSARARPVSRVPSRAAIARGRIPGRRGSCAGAIELWSRSWRSIRRMRSHWPGWRTCGRWSGARAEACELMVRARCSPQAAATCPRFISRSATSGSDDHDRAFEALEQAWLDRDPALATITVEPRFAPLRDDPRYLELLERLKMPISPGIRDSRVQTTGLATRTRKRDAARRRPLHRCQRRSSSLVILRQLCVCRHDGVEFVDDGVQVGAGDRRCRTDRRRCRCRHGCRCSRGSTRRLRRAPRESPCTSAGRAAAARFSRRASRPRAAASASPVCRQRERRRGQPASARAAHRRRLPASSAASARPALPPS